MSGGQGQFWEAHSTGLVATRSPRTLARRGHPETSVDGARASERSRARIYQVILEDLERRKHPATSKEIGRATGEEAWKRMRELERAGLVVECPQRRCRVSRVKALTWSLKR